LDGASERLNGNLKLGRVGHCHLSVSSACLEDTVADLWERWGASCWCLEQVCPAHPARSLLMFGVEQGAELGFCFVWHGPGQGEKLI